MIACSDADVLAAALSVGSIDREDEGALHAHLAACPDCRHVAGEYMEAAARLPIALEPVRPSAALRTRLMKAVYAEAATRSAAHAVSAAPWYRRVWAAIPSGRGFTVVAGAAAVVVVGVSVWGLGNRQVSPASSRTVALTVMPAAAHAHGQLVYDSAANQAVLTVDDLPGPSAVRASGAIYEVWLVPATGAPVAAAFLTKGPDGSWTAALHGTMSAYATVAATVEPAGGSTAPTGVEVFQASLTG